MDNPSSKEVEVVLEDGRDVKRRMTESSTGNSASEAAVDTVFECVVNYIKDPHDLGAVSLVCRRWYEIEAAARKHVKISLCYAATPEMLCRRFPNLESLKLKGKPRAAMFNLIPENWGGYVAPWVDEIAVSFSSLKALHFRRMIIADPDLRLLAQSRGSALVLLKLDKCSGFSTDGLLHIARASKQTTSLITMISLPKFFKQNLFFNQFRCKCL